MDVVASREIANLDRVAAALRELGAFLRVGGLDDETARSLPVVLDGENLANLDLSTWRTDAGDINILAVLRSEDGSRIEYDDLRGRAQRSRLGDIEVTLASLDDIIASKRVDVPEGRRIAALASEPGHDPSEVRSRPRRRFIVARIDLLILVLAMGDMVFRPGQ